jgi:hypothetical protein
MTRYEGKSVPSECSRRSRTARATQSRLCMGIHQPLQGTWWEVNINFVLCDPNKGRMALTRMDIYLSPVAVRLRKRESSGPLDFKVRDLDTGPFRLAVIFGGTGQMSPETDNPLKGVADTADTIVRLPERHPRSLRSHRHRDGTLAGGAVGRDWVGLTRRDAMERHLASSTTADVIL